MVNEHLTEASLKLQIHEKALTELVSSKDRQSSQHELTLQAA